MIRVTVPRPVAEALMPRACPHVDCEGEGDTHCWGCHGSGVLPPSLRLLVVEVERELHILRPPDYRLEVRPEPPASIVRAIEAGERIGIDVECETCEGDGFRPVEERLPGNHNYEQWKCPACNTKGVVPVGSVRPVRVLPVREGLTSHIDTPVGQWLSVWRRDLRLDPPGYELVAAIQSCDGHHIRTRPIDAAPLGVYGTAESLVGKFAVEVEDARREP